MNSLVSDTQYQSEEDLEEDFSDLDLPLIPMPEELQNLPPLPENQERVLRTLAKHAVQIIKERIRNGTLQIPKEGVNLEGND